MEYRKYIRQLTADVLNKKKSIEDIKIPSDFFYVQYALLKMRKMEMVKYMGDVASKRNKNGGWIFSKKYGKN